MLPREPHVADKLTFAEHTLDELWSGGARFQLSSRSLTRGMALTEQSDHGMTVEATTDFSSSVGRALADRLLSIAVLESHRDSALEAVSHTGAGVIALRIVLSHRIEDEHETMTTLIRVELRSEHGPPLALLTTPRDVSEDIERIAALTRTPITVDRSDLDQVPLVWTSGTGGVLLHEGAGHPAGIAPAMQWPPWLRVVDDPDRTTFELPLGDQPRRQSADLLASERPSRDRRGSFRDHPMPRMSSLVATVSDAPFDLPPRRVEIELAGGGSWDPLTDEVRVNVVSATLIHRDARMRLAPFEIVADRRSIARALTGGRGEPTRYPGVLCSEHGQRLPVGTWCAELITEGL